jgi:hypothetical protein
LARTFAIALVFTLLVALSLVAGSSPASATEPPGGANGSVLIAAQESPSAPDDTSEEEAWRGDVPIKGVIGGTAALLGVLTVVAVRREWVI